MTAGSSLDLLCVLVARPGTWVAFKKARTGWEVRATGFCLGLGLGASGGGGGGGGAVVFCFSLSDSQFSADFTRLTRYKLTLDMGALGLPCVALIA